MKCPYCEGENPDFYWQHNTYAGTFETKESKCLILPAKCKKCNGELHLKFKLTEIVKGVCR